MPKLFIGGLAPDFTELHIAQLLAIYGEILTVKLIYDRSTNKSKGYGFVEMAERSQALQAIEALNGTTIANREIQLNLVENEPIHQQKNPVSQQAPAKTKRQRKVSYQQVSNFKPEVIKKAKTP